VVTGALTLGGSPLPYGPPPLEGGLVHLSCGTFWWVRSIGDVKDYVCEPFDPREMHMCRLEKAHIALRVESALEMCFLGLYLDWGQVGPPMGLADTTKGGLTLGGGSHGPTLLHS